MIKKKNKIKLTLLLVIFVVVGIIIFNFVDYNKIIDLGNQFHCKIILYSLFSESILLINLNILNKVITKSNRLKRLKEHYYLDNFYNISVISIICSKISIILASYLLSSKSLETISKCLIALEFTTFLCGFFTQQFMVYMVITYLNMYVLEKKV